MPPIELPFVHQGMHTSQAIEQWLFRMGYDCLHIQTGQRIRCYCFDPRLMSADPKCCSCFGTGWTVKVMRRKVRSDHESVPETLTRLVREADFGRASVSARSFFMTSSPPVRIQDLIVLCEFDRFGRPEGEVAFYFVNHVSVYRGSRAEPLVQVAFGHRDVVDVPYKRIRVLELESTATEDTSHIPKLSADLSMGIGHYKQTKSLTYFVQGAS